jgi:hypothetical protein
MTPNAQNASVLTSAELRQHELQNLDVQTFAWKMSYTNDTLRLIKTLDEVCVNSLAIASY